MERPTKDNITRRPILVIYDDHTKVGWHNQKEMETLIREHQVDEVIINGVTTKFPKHEPTEVFPEIDL